MNILHVLIFLVLGLATLVNSIEDTTYNEDHQASFVVSKNDEDYEYNTNHRRETRELDGIARQLSKSGKGSKKSSWSSTYNWNSSSSSSSSDSKNAWDYDWKKSSSRDKWNWRSSSRSYKWNWKSSSRSSYNDKCGNHHVVINGESGMQVGASVGKITGVVVIIQSLIKVYDTYMQNKRATSLQCKTKQS